MFERKGKLICSRCNTFVDAQNKLSSGSVYCGECLVFGRNISGEKLYYFPQKKFPGQHSLVWEGQLTPYQDEVSKGIIKSLAREENVLVHAVTGAGKTEMIYKAVSDVLDKGGCVGIDSPRIDVCLELYKRLTRDFTCPISLLYADSDAYQRSPLIILTTHQLIKFYEAFDLLIIERNIR